MDQTPTVVVAGGAGYIGSHMVRMLRDNGLRPVVVDNLATGHREAVGTEVLKVGDIGDAAFMGAVLREFQPRCVMHFAASSLVGESMAKPGKYWRNNVVQTLNLLDTMLEHGVRQFIFSSTAATYGNPVEVPIPEGHPTRPINPYGHSKLAVEYALQDYSQAHGLRSISLRYFNAAGAHPDASIGEHHEPETHLIPLVLQVASGRREFISRYGSNHATPDGSCLRDYIHVQDLCAAHLAALRALEAGAATTVYNLGNGKGHSVNEVIEVARKVTGHPIPLRDDPPRAGDPPALVADAARARAELGWTPQYEDLDTIVAHAWQWERKLHQAAGTA
ncbi:MULTISPECIES: UDP-glucose 4-epimerase GalE [Ramlibacter]|uniref:UDP-glucose 4-epimerase n=1 Tax=Ramlibacter pinisoli TaxID=2682844 RepID=A0A6N8IXH2_9BURK|nr:MULTISPECIES: UDP-glucose 4-epimerase GalE [Ramlibacter]MBA2960736.1 UDP-glucose 4-epimerase GalE [Ramlibacter sp. CGMCC 1.13660]MVQ30683.1 UDP-glucose 4-epimerase GalE [Ramlibacter pinisoli]